MKGHLEQVPAFKTLADTRLVVKLANEIVNNSAVLQNDDELYFAVGPNETWAFEICLRLIQANAAADWNFNLTCPVGGTGTFLPATDETGQTAVIGFGTGKTVSNALTTETRLKLEGLLANGATAGDLRLQWAQLNQTASDNTILASSYIKAVRLV